MTLAEALKRALAETTVSHAALERMTGVDRNTIARFLWGETSLRLDKADDLARFFGIESRFTKGSDDGIFAEEDEHETRS